MNPYKHCKECGGVIPEKDWQYFCVLVCSCNPEILLRRNYLHEKCMWNSVSKRWEEK